MTEMNDMVDKVQERVLETIRTTGEMTASAVQSWRGVAERFMPELPPVPGLDNIPSSVELTETMLDFSAKLLEAQREAMLAIATALTVEKEAPAQKKAPKAEK
jgi:hypothetical protein